MFAIIAPTFTYPNGIQLGTLQSQHRTAEAARRAMERRQRVTRRANPGAHLDLAIISVEWTDGAKARGTVTP